MINSHLPSLPCQSQIFAVVIALVGSVLPLESSQADEGSWAVALKTSLSLVEVADIDHNGTIGTGRIIDGILDGAIRENQTEDYTAGVGFALIWKFGRWRSELDYTYRYRSDWDIVTTTPSIQSITNIFSDIETHTLMLNLAYRYPISNVWSWEAGAGIGRVQNRINAEYLERAVPGVSSEFRVTDNSFGNEFTYAVFAGLNRKLGDKWQLNMRYRYIDLGDLDIGPFPIRSSAADATFSANEFQVSLERDL